MHNEGEIPKRKLVHCGGSWWTKSIEGWKAQIMTSSGISFHNLDILFTKNRVNEARCKSSSAGHRKKPYMRDQQFGALSKFPKRRKAIDVAIEEHQTT